MKPQFLIALLFIITLTAKAQISTDGTLGTPLNLPGPDYQIGANLGQQYGGNLFHSFQNFNLQSFESATFTGPNSVANIISRVTGGHPSNIDGLIRSTISNADMYLINPYGIMFGPNVRLDVQGSFHASTADYLRLQDGGHFEARHPNNSLLSLAPIEAFGFWHTPVAPISVQGHGEITAADWNGGLRVPEGQTLSLIGGNLDIKQGTFLQTIDDDSNEVTEIIRLPILSAPYGRINLASVASRGELTFGRDFLGVSSFSQLADISITANTLIQTSGEGGGNIFIRGGQFVVDNSTIEAKTLENQNGGVIDIRADNLSLTYGSSISSLTEGSGRGADIYMQATDSITIVGNNDFIPNNLQNTSIYARSGVYAQISDDNFNLGDAGHIEMKAKNIFFKEGRLSTSTFGGGKGGDIKIKASEHVSIGGKENSNASLIATATYSDSNHAGDAGNISIEAKNISLTSSSYMNSNTNGKGKGGNITFKAVEEVLIEGIPPNINIDTKYMGEGGGNAGNLLIEAETISLKGAEISGITLGDGDASTITLHADTIFLEGSSINTNTAGINPERVATGNAGTIRIHANQLKLSGVTKNSYGSAINAITWNGSNGHASDIIIEAQNVLLSDGASLSSSSVGSGKAGNVQVNATGTVTIIGANQRGWSSHISSNSNPNAKNIIGGEGGNVTIVANRLILKDGGMITASSIAPKDFKGGQGGNIILRIQGSIELSGVNPYGENEQGFSSGIYTQSNGFLDNAGDAGSITLQADSLIIKNGAVIKSSTNNQAQGGTIEIHVNGTAIITGDASQISLKEPGESQLEYVEGFSLTDYNQSTSGIYTRSESQSEQGGHSGNVKLSADKLIMTDKAQISTSSAGGGKAGQIMIKVNQLQLDNRAAISSESKLNNTYQFANLAERDGQLLVLGDVVEVANVGDGKIARYINIGNRFIRVTPVYTVADMAALDKLTHKYDIIEGDIVEVTNERHRKPARFIYIDTQFADANGWIRLNDQVKASFDSMAYLEKIIKENNAPTFHPGDIIEVNAENGKPITLIMFNVVYPDNLQHHLQSRIVNQFTVTDLVTLDELTKTSYVEDGAVAIITDMGDGTPSRFIYQNGAWIAFQNLHTVADIAEMNNALTLAKTGNIAEITDVGTGQPGHFLYSGREWLPLNYTPSDSLTPSYPTVANHSELENRTAKPGDIVSVADTNTGRYNDFFYVDGKWKKIVNGGDAGTITITAHDGVIMSNQSAITTEAVNAGGGGITLQTNNLVLLRDSKITTSVQNGASDGGNLTIDAPQFLVLNNGQIIAQAYEGHGGNIRLGMVTK